MEFTTGSGVGVGVGGAVGVGVGSSPGRAVGVGSVPSTTFTPLEAVGGVGREVLLGSGSRFFREVVIRMTAAAMMARSTTAPTITCQRVLFSTVEALPSRFFRAPQWGHLLRSAL